MTTEIRHAGSSYSARLLDRARRELRGADGSAALEFAKCHGVKRTTVLGWKRKVGARKPLQRKGAPRKFGAFEETKLLEELIKNNRFQDPETIMDYARKLDVALAKRTVQRMLTRWNIIFEKQQWQSCSSKGRRVLLLQRSDWVQPEETVCVDALPLRGVLWLLINGRGIECLMLTNGSGQDPERVVGELEGKIGPRHGLQTNSPEVAALLLQKQPQWKVTVRE